MCRAETGAVTAGSALNNLLTMRSLVFGVAALPPSAQHGELALREGAGQLVMDLVDVGEFLVVHSREWPVLPLIPCRL